MKKHEMIYHERTNTIEFISQFCTHSREISKSNKKKHFFREEIFFESINFFEIQKLEKELDENHLHQDSVSKKLASEIIKF